MSMGAVVHCRASAARRDTSSAVVGWLRELFRCHAFTAFVCCKLCLRG